MAKEIKYGAEARRALEAGVNQLADTVTLFSQSVLLKIRPYPQPDSPII